MIPGFPTVDLCGLLDDCTKAAFLSSRASIFLCPTGSFSLQV
jgi:hypothetical protein